MNNVHHSNVNRIRGTASTVTAAARRGHSRNKQWTATDGISRSGTNSPNHVDGERWERGGSRGGGRGRGRGRGGRKFPNQTLRNTHTTKVNEAVTAQQEDVHTEIEEEEMEDIHEDAHEDVHEGVHEENYADLGFPEPDEPVLETQEERDRFYQELVKAREVERKRAIAEGKMDDPLVPKRLEDAITMVGTCMDMCPRFERYRRERENNLFEWETIPGTKRVDHKRAVKMYERAAGDKTLPSDLRPPIVLKRTLDYLFHDLLPRGGFIQTFNFIRDRSRAVRNDFTMQHESGPLAIECHDRCARFHILALHFMRDQSGFSIALEEQQLMNTLQSLKEFYEEQRERYESPTELEMRVYHRLIHIRDQKERHEEIPEHITSHPVFKLTTDFRLHVQKKSAPITKTSPLLVDAQGMQIFAKLAGVLREQGSVVMIYLVACILERLFGKDTIEDIEAIRGDLSIPDIVDGKAVYTHDIEEEKHDVDLQNDEEEVIQADDEFESTEEDISRVEPADTTPYAFGPPSNQSTVFGQPSQPAILPSIAMPSAGSSAFASLTSTSNVFGSVNVFGGASFPVSSTAKTTSVPGPSVFASAPASTPMKPKNNATGVKLGPPRSIFSSLADAPPLADENKVATESSIRSAEAPVSRLPSAPSFFSIDSSRLNGAPKSTTSVAPFDVSASVPALFPQQVEQNIGASSFFAASTKSSLSPSAPAFTSSSVGPALQASASPPLKVPNGTSTSQPANTLAFSTTADEMSQKAAPALIRKSATPPLKIETKVPIPTPFAKPVHSPILPPPLKRQQPVSLPSTPTANVPNPLVNHIKATLDVTTPSGSPIRPGILSPLDLPSPSVSGLALINNFSPERPLARKSSLSMSKDTKGKSPESTSAPSISSKEAQEQMKAKADVFAKERVLKRYYKRWRQRVQEVMAWLEAVEHSDAYRAKVESQRRRARILLDKRRRTSLESVASEESPTRKRQRKRHSDYHEPRTDEEIAMRLKQNREENERRWAQGSYLQIIRAHVQNILPRSTLKTCRSWNIWLSLNPENDSTAIWLERKFDVPSSGRWATESIFSIPLFQDKDDGADWNPGLIVFERTPLDSLQDDIEKKYRILDDCSRLRDVIDAFSPKRHYIPSLLLLNWSTEEQQEFESDFFRMVEKYLDESTIATFATLRITTSINLDDVLAKLLQTMKLDVEGKLVRSTTIRGVFQTFDEDFNAFLLEWFDNCSVNGYFDWCLYGHVIQATTGLLNKMSSLVLALLSKPKDDVLPLLDIKHLRDSDTAYDKALGWLSHIDKDGDTDAIYLDLQSHINIGQAFPARTFIEHLLELTVLRTEKQAGVNPQEIVYIPYIDLRAAEEVFESCIRPFQSKLGQAFNMSIRRSPKRRGVSEETEDILPEAKRTKLEPAPSSVLSVSVATEHSPPTTPYMNGRHSRSASITSNFSSVPPSAIGSETPSQVTVAMLRALTRDVKKKYASPNASLS